MCRRHRTVALLTALGAAIGCSKSTTRLPPPGPDPQLELVSAIAKTTEGTDTTKSQQFRLEVTVANVGEVKARLATFVVVDAAFFKGPLRVGLPEFARAPEADLSLLAPGESRVLPFVAMNRNDGRCPSPATCDQNPHSDLLDLSATVTGDFAAWFIHTPIAFTCENEGHRVCPADLVEACKGTDAAGNPLRCLRRWSEVASDKLCGIAESDTITYCSGRRHYRTVRVGGVDYQYHYVNGLDLIGVTTGDGACVAGHCAGVPVPPPEDCDEPSTLYQCSGPTSDAAVDGP